MCTYASYYRRRNNSIPDKQSARFEEADHRESRSVRGAIDGLDSIRIRPDKKSGLKRVSPPATISYFFSFAARRLSSYRILPPSPLCQHTLREAMPTPRLRSPPNSSAGRLLRSAEIAGTLSKEQHSVPHAGRKKSTHRPCVR